MKTPKASMGQRDSSDRRESSGQRESKAQRESKVQRGRRRGRFREFAMGRNWWVMPTVYLVGQFIAFFAIERMTGFDGESPWDWVLFISLMIGSPTLAAILLSPGFRISHLAMAAAAILIGGVVFSIQSDSLVELTVVSAVVAMIQVFVLRMTRIPPWVVRPANSERHQKASIGWLMVMTVIVALLITVMRVSQDGGQYLVAFGYLGLAMLTALLGNVIAGLCSRKTRWLILLVVAGLGWASMLAAEAGILSLEPWERLIELQANYAAKIVCLSPAVALINVVLVHRMMTLAGAIQAVPSTPRVELGSAQDLG
ncbi:hypothetical protein NB063_11245 [Rhodopirellula sp. ICT_H3.1]|uniref:MASE1 domain-containing protein n=1 Tax=Aporhodopirellula aestuarii TaxID=2950107 RepID=A0ABT0U2Q6_9BACT|nr:hypothetical protein [Aporhodopirellula aestuarii]